MDRDLAAELIALRRSLPPDAAMAARFPGAPADGMTVAIPEDARRRLEVHPVGDGWAVAEVLQLPEPLQPQRSDIGAFDTAGAARAVDLHYRRLRLEARNEACGTPTEGLDRS